jgi:hypothetical protein
MLSVLYAECHRYAHYAESRYAKCRYAEYRYAECHGASRASLWIWKLFCFTGSRANSIKITAVTYDRRLRAVTVIALSLPVYQ